MMTVHHEPRSLTSHPRLLDITQYIIILASQVKTYLPVDRELISGRHFHNIGINSPDLMNVIIMASEIPRAINYIKLRQNGDSSWQSPSNRSMYQRLKVDHLDNPLYPHGNKFAGCWSLIFWYIGWNQPDAWVGIHDSDPYRGSMG